MLTADLKKIPAFKNFSKGALQNLSKLTVVKEYDDNRLIFKEGANRDKIFIIIQGLIVIEKGVLNQQETLAVFRPHDIIGENLLFSPGGRHNYTAKSYAPHTKILELSVYNLLKLFKLYPETSHQLHQYAISILSERLDRTNEKLLTLFVTRKLATNYKNKEHLAEAILLTIQKLFRVKKTMLVHFDTAGRRLIIEHSLGYGRKFIPKVVSLDADTLISLVLNTKSPLLITPGTWEKKFRTAPYATNNMLLVPIKTKAATIGCLVLADKLNGRHFNLNNEILLTAIAEQLSPSLDELNRQQEKRNLEQLQQTYIDPFYT